MGTPSRARLDFSTNGKEEIIYPIFNLKIYIYRSFKISETIFSALKVLEAAHTNCNIPSHQGGIN